MDRHRRSPSILALAALVVAGGCASKKMTCDEFPTSVGFEPLEPTTDVAWPAPTATDTYPQALSLSIPAASPTHAWAHGRGYLHYPLAKVLEALKDPAAILLVIPEPHETTVTMGVEAYLVSFNVEYTVHKAGNTVDWNILYRGGVAQGTEVAPEVIGLRYQKTCGSDYIGEESGSFLAYPLPADPSITQFEMVGWLRAYTQDANSVQGTLTDWFANLTAKLASMP